MCARASSKPLEAAKSLAPLIRARAAAAERQGRLDDEVVEAFHEARLWGLGAPRAVGGLELDPVEALEVIEEISYADGSTGWVLMAAMLAIGTGGAYLGDAAVERIFAGDRMPIIEGQGSPNGQATVAEGGYTLSGSWSYGSGLLHSDWVHTGALVFEADGSPRLLPGGLREGRIFVLPRDEVDFGGNWDVLGLRATGSIDYSIGSKFVSDEYTHVFTTETPLRGGPLYTIGISGFGGIGHSGFALGVGRRVLDELAALVQEGVARPGQLAGNEHFQTEFADAEARYRAARAFVYETWHGVEQTLRRGDSPSTRERTLFRLALNHVTSTVAELCRFVYASTGGLSLRESAVQRYFRDMHAGTQHASVGQAVLRSCGRELAGLACGQVWRFRDLVDAG